MTHHPRHEMGSEPDASASSLVLDGLEVDDASFGADSQDGARPESDSDGAFDEDGRVAGTLVDGRYELIEPLGVGGMGTVWRARDFVLDVDVALKLVRSDKLKAVGVERLIREARATASIQDPAVVRVQGFGTCKGDGYIAMELLAGRTLEGLLDEEGSLPEAEAVRVMLPVVDALAVAHQAGVVHRDVKPANIMLVEGPAGIVQPKLLDFGIAHHRRSAERNRLTCTGQVLGTPYYMSYEQAAGRKDVDHRADIWAVCSVLYELVAGIGPFDGDNYNAVLRAVLMDPPMPLVEVMPEADEELWTVIERGLAKDKEARWSSMQELGLALRRWLVKRGYRTDVAGRMLVTSDLPEPIDPTLDEVLDPFLGDEAGNPSLTATMPAAPPISVPASATGLGGITADDSGPTPPQGFALPIRPPVVRRHRLGMALAACALFVAPLATLGSQGSATELETTLAALSGEAGEALAGVRPIEEANDASAPALAPRKTSSDTALSTVSSTEALASEQPTDRRDEPEAAPARAARPKATRAAPSLPEPEIASKPAPSRRYAPGTTLPLPTAPRFR